MIVYRVETESHDGPFQNRNGFTALSSAILPNGQKIWNFSEYTHPAYPKDFGWGVNTGAASFFGCLSLEHLKKWFGYEHTVEYLKKHSFQISKYDADREHVIAGKSGIQCIFDMIFATKLRDYPIEELLKENMV